VLEDELAEFRGDHPVSPTLEELHAKSGLQRLNALRQCRLRDPQRRGCPPEIRVLGEAGRVA
jgi:hypothetical protein